jgi:hypothetical protein
MERRSASAPSTSVSDLDPRAAREAFLKTLAPDEQALVLLRAEKMGPLPTDPDWIMALAVTKAADRIAMEVAKIETVVARIEVQSKNRVQQVPRESGRGVYHSTCLTLWAFALSLSAFSLVAYFVERFSSAHLQVIVLYCMALAVGVSASAFYVWMAPYISRR